MHWTYYAVRFIIRALLFILIRWQVKGQENIPARGPLLIVANHMSLADPPLLGVAINRKAMFMAKEELFRGIPGYFMRNFGAFPVRRGGLDRHVVKLAGQYLAQGMALTIFPEGKRSKDAKLQPAFPGSALIALRFGAPVLPVGITGTEKITGLTWCLQRPKITINIGHAFQPTPGINKSTKTELARLTSSIMDHIAELLPPGYHGYYGENKKL